jgi:hypothetical protein
VKWLPSAPGGMSGLANAYLTRGGPEYRAQPSGVTSTGAQTRIQVLSTWGSPSVCFRCSARFAVVLYSYFSVPWPPPVRKGRSCVGWYSPVGRDLVCGRRGGA